MFRQVWLVLSPFLVAFFVLYGNSWLQRRLARRIRDADELKRRLYDLLELTSEYWTAHTSATSPKSALEARILASKSIVAMECSEMARHSRRLKAWLLATEPHRADFMDAITGGSFQQKSWSPDPQRVTRAATAIQQVVSALNRAC